MNILSKQTFELVQQAVSSYGAKEVANHADIFLSDDLLQLYLNQKGEDVVSSIKVLLDSPKELNYVCENFHLSLVEYILNSLIESEYVDGKFLLVEPLLKERIFVDCSFYF